MEINFLSPILHFSSLMVFQSGLHRKLFVNVDQFQYTAQFISNGMVHVNLFYDWTRIISIALLYYISNIYNNQFPCAVPNPGSETRGDI